ncbi:MAG: PepSY domain-containing protein [Clostridia bacterium]|nr:PepSY domain-containing protein [Clostridia bacterium]
MKKRELENALRTAVTRATPDKLDDILSVCDRQEGTVISMTNKKKTSLLTRIVGIAAALVLLVAGGGLGLHLYQTQAVASTVMLDVNPSLALQVNHKDKVLSVTAENEDGAVVLGDMDLVGTDVQVAVNALVGAMLRKGYISEVANSILISVDGKDDAKATELKTVLAQEVDTVLKDAPAGGAVLSQTVKKDDSVAALMEKYNISAGKAVLIQRIIKSNTAYTADDLAALSINELNLLSNSGKHPAQDVDSQGVASQGKYIGADRAKEIALTHAQIDEQTIWDLEVDMEFENGAMVYEVSFDHDVYEFKYDINATTGEIIKFKKELDDKDVEKPDNEQKPTQQLPAEAVGEAAAKQAAFAHANVNEADVVGYKCKVDEDDGKWVYEIEFVSGNYEYEYEIDALTGVVVDYDREYDDDVKAPANQTKPEKPVVTVDEKTAKQAAFAHAGVNEADVVGCKCKLDEDDGKWVYEIEFVCGGYEYSYEIDAQTGAVIEHEHEQDDDAKAPPAAAQTQPSQTQPSEPPKVDKDDAKQTALDHAGVKEEQAQNHRCELDEEGNKPVYEVEFKHGDYEYEYKIDAHTGEIVHSEKDFHR